MTNANQKRALAAHDISCFGRCSLTVALPILSAVGVECSVLPTAILSTHTGGFQGFTWRDLTDDIMPIANHWKELGLGFDAIYTGFLGSFEQIEIIKTLFDMFKGENTIIVADPVMADGGKLYSVFGDDFPAGMRGLCQKADVIVPNLTEAAFMLGEEYVPAPYTKKYIEGMLKKLSDIGPGKVVLTGVGFKEGELGAACFDAETGEIGYAISEKVGGSYHGTGDVFASALTGALIKGRSLNAACAVAVDFTLGAIKRSFAAKSDWRYGVNFEEGLGALAAELGK